MGVFVGVDPAEDSGSVWCHNGDASSGIAPMCATTGRDGAQDTHGVQLKAPDLLEWGQHPGPDGGVGCEDGDRSGARQSWVQCPTMRRRCQRNSVSGVTNHPARLGRGNAAAIAPSKLRSASPNWGRLTWRRNTPNWWRNMMISRSFERPDRTVSRASDARNR